MGKKTISMVGVPMDLGQSRRGVDMGPAAIRYAGVVERLENLGYEINDLGNIEIENVGKDAKREIRNVNAIVEVNRKLAHTVEKIMEEGSFPLVLGGDHSIAIGTIAGVSKFFHQLGVIWYDAHGDLNTPETSPSGNIHGMPLATSLGLGERDLVNIGGYAPKLKYENIVIIGARSLDEGEKDLIKKKGIKVYTMHEVDRMGMSAIIEETIAYLKNKTDGIHLSFDLDALDPIYAPGVGTPVSGGVTFRETHLALEMLAETNLITSAEFVEVNPILDERNKTGSLTVELIGSLFGERIL
ncbi:arginase [Fervidibacillus albus]|uniref:Arginase n=1 Tax=Fervidibacillus albus TaxID=2980026 RepID=A0A9E8LTK4_9BACI|nr:arginase [Fervidibacillus albus]WAA09385.1 arginase [Fervidibacillus albus]